MTEQQGFPNINSPLVDARTGQINQTWLQFLISLWTRTGGGPGRVVTSFNGRTGAVTLLGQDVEDALGYLPVSPEVIAGGWKGFIISPVNNPDPPETGLFYSLPEVTAVIDGNIVTYAAIDDTSTGDDVITDYWGKPDGTYLIERQPLNNYPALPRYPEYLHVWKVQAEDGEISAISLMSDTYPVIHRPMDTARVVDQFVQYYVIETTTTPWSNGLAVTFRELVETSSGYVYQVFESGNLGAVEPTTTDPETFTSGTATLAYYSQSNFLGNFRYGLNNGIQNYFSNIGALNIAYMVTSDGTLMTDYVKDYLLSQFLNVIHTREDSSPYLYGMKVIADGWIWRCSVAGTSDATDGAFVAAQPHSLGQMVTDGTAEWTAIYEHYGSQDWFWMDTDRTFLVYRAPDSHDSYASTFLSALANYISLTDDWTWLQGNSTWPDGSGGYLTYEEVLDGIYDFNLSNQITNFLTNTFQDEINPRDGSAFTVQYLEDACESYSGFKDITPVFVLLGDATREANAIFCEATMASGIFNLYSITNGVFAYYYGQDTGDFVDNPNINFYPWMQAQLFPELHQISSVNNDMKQSVRLWVSEKWDSWWADRTKGTTPENFGGYIAARYWQDTAKAYCFVENTERYYLDQGAIVIHDFAYYLRIKDLLMAPIRIIAVTADTITIQTINNETFKFDVSGYVEGPASSTDNAFSRWDGTTGRLLKNSQTTENSSGDVAIVGDVTAANLSGTNTGDVTLAGENYLSLTGQQITANAVDLSGTNATGVLAEARFPILDGDVTNSSGDTEITVIALQTRAVVNSAPNDADVLTWVTANNQWEPLPPTGGGGSSAFALAAASFW